MTTVDEHEMVLKLKKAQQRVRKILGECKHPILASKVEHQYEDKFQLVEFICNSGLASHLTFLEELSVSAEQLRVLKYWSFNSTVTLRFRTEETCCLLRTETREQDASSHQVVEGGGKAI